MHKLLYLVLCSSLWTACQPKEAKICVDSFVDERDGTEYCMVTMGTQTWMAENLQYQSDTVYKNPLFPNAVNTSYGYLYTFKEANKACPNGWHLPTDAEWKTLEMHLGMSSTASNTIYERGTDEGRQLKATEGWKSSAMVDVEGTNSAGFKALPAGYRNPSYGPFGGLEAEAIFWTASAYDTLGHTAWVRALEYDKGGVIRTYASRKMGYSCRCIKD